ncbi:hypothetical protein FQN50_003212 [Emmonsiellopsis sp. PD_5]|nr:hypothetical protein FQN50_003212 [Emmonsiellopsis sp. PD_5]
MAISENYVTESQVKSTGYVMIALASAFLLTRFGVRFSKSRGLIWEDLFVVLSWLSFLAMSILYIIVIPAVYRVSGVMSGTSPLYATMEKDALSMKKIFFATTLLLWVSLWSVKLSLLVLYRRLLAGLPTEIRLWWGILIFTLLAFIGCVISNFTSCNSMSAWFNITGCMSPREVKAQIASLYYSYAVDVIADIMIMALPTKLLWSLRLPMIQKISLACIFCIGIICVGLATLRVAQIGGHANSNSTPSSSWLAFWGILEAGIAVIVGCLPALAIIFRQDRLTRRTYGRAYTSMEGYSNQNSIPLSATSNATNKPLRQHDIYAVPPSPSVSNLKGIAVTQSMHVSHPCDPMDYPPETRLARLTGTMLISDA